MSWIPTCAGCKEPLDWCRCPTTEEAAEIASLAIPTFDVTRVPTNAIVDNEEFARCSTTFMARAGVVGWPEAALEEMGNPSCDHPMWYDLIEAVYEGKPVPPPTTPDPLRATWCIHCGDSGTIVSEHKRKPKHSHIEYPMVRQCTFCPKGRDFAWIRKERSDVRLGDSTPHKDQELKPASGFKQAGGAKEENLF